MSDRDELASDVDLAIQRAMEAADLRAGDSLGASTAVVGAEHEPAAAEAGDVGGAIDGD
ncbi:hypothetical protein [Agromyces sp. Marseille-Q5079]|uniref:hypothetical protein n=1 Tax=Agromyces sp. Marseille-Q5079 TaxID=3439059 RepID=UPI003D9C8CBC